MTKSTVSDNNRKKSPNLKPQETIVSNSEILQEFDPLTNKILDNEALKKEEQEFLNQKAPPSLGVSQDTIIVNASSRKEIISPEISTLSSSISSEEAVDPITKAIREQILEEQRKILRLGMVDKNPELAQQLENDEKFREFLRTLNAEQKKLIDEALKNEKIKKQLEEIELKGYQKIHLDFKDNFKIIEWDGPKGENNNKTTTQSQKITNDVGGEICTLIETTHAIKPITVLDGSNNPITIKSYRTIDFPTKFDDNSKGSMHLSMGALDANGNRPPVDQAIYFTAHYEEGPGGKPLLKEISSPMPIKFNGPGEDAIGYVEHSGKIYTMPVTRGKYKEMIQEVALNKGQSVDLSQIVEISKDYHIGAKKENEISGVQHNKVEPAVTPASPPPLPPRPKASGQGEEAAPTAAPISTNQVPPLPPKPITLGQAGESKPITHESVMNELKGSAIYKEQGEKEAKAKLFSELPFADESPEAPKQEPEKSTSSVPPTKKPFILESLWQDDDLPPPPSQVRNQIHEKVQAIRNTLSSSAPIISLKNSSQQIIDEYNKQNTFDEKKDFIEKKLVNNKALSKEERLGVIDKLSEQQNKRRSAVFEGTLKGETAATRVSSEKTELKPLNMDDSGIEKSRREVVTDKVNVKDDIKIRNFLAEAKGKINEEPGRSIKTLSQSSKNIREK
ncbi:Sca4 family spreading effector [Rickettsia endosymbiont of Halotydeus destructor]|uniref:Sca4 family spreading effector n=1 Tax=Rickettsia endosymbiont of Halotydeus destructor TaxID=2996754 RepID=UPI003BB03D04